MDKYVIIDIRRPEEIEEINFNLILPDRRIRTIEYISFSKILDLSSKKEAGELLGSDEEMFILVCRTGNRAFVAWNHLGKLGVHNSVILKGGIKEFNSEFRNK